MKPSQLNGVSVLNPTVANYLSSSYPTIFIRPHGRKIGPFLGRRFRKNQQVGSVYFIFVFVQALLL